YEERVAAQASIRELLDSGVEAQLRAIPGVHHVSIGLKQRAGIAYKEFAIRVYVREKRPEDSLQASDRVPREIDGVPTDVNVVPGFGFSVDETRYRPVKGGSLISNGIIYDHEGEPSIGVGTFGCTASRITDG